MTKHAAYSERHTTTPFAALSLANGPMLAAWTRGGEACAKAYLAWQEEALRFADLRLRKDRELGQAMIDCRGWTELARLQQDWAAATAQDYLDEARRVAELAAKLAQESLAPWQPVRDTPRRDEAA